MAAGKHVPALLCDELVPGQDFDALSLAAQQRPDVLRHHRLHRRHLRLRHQALPQRVERLKEVGEICRCRNYFPEE